MSFKTIKKAQALAKNDRWYNQQELHDAWLHVLTGPYGDAIIYSLCELAEKPYIKLDDINPYACVFREGKRDVVEQVLRIVNAELTKEQKWMKKWNSNMKHNTKSAVRF